MPKVLRPHRNVVRLSLLLLTFSIAGGARAAAPFVIDDPWTTDYRHWEIYAFDSGESAPDGGGGEAGLDMSYGAGQNLQVNLIVPAGYSQASGGPLAGGLGNIELAAKYRFLHVDSLDADVAVYPRVFLPSGSAAAGERHASFFLPVWLGKEWGPWWASGGGGCEINRGGNSRDFCIAGAVLTRDILPKLRIGGEVYAQTADAKGGRNAVTVGAGFIYDVSETYHLLGYASTGLRSADDPVGWYAAFLFTF